MPSVAITLAQDGDGATILNLLDHVELPRISMSSTRPTICVRVPVSPSVLVLRISGCKKAPRDSVVILVDGRSWPIDAGEVVTARVKLEEDAELRLITCVVDGRFALCLIIDVLAYRPIN